MCNRGDEITVFYRILLTKELSVYSIIWFLVISCTPIKSIFVSTLQSHSVHIRNYQNIMNIWLYTLFDYWVDQYHLGLYLNLEFYSLYTHENYFRCITRKEIKWIESDTFCVFGVYKLLIWPMTSYLCIQNQLFMCSLQIGFIDDRLRCQCFHLFRLRFS